MKVSLSFYCRCTIVKVKEEFWVGVEAAQTLIHVDAMSGEDTNEDDDSDKASTMHGKLLFLQFLGFYILTYIPNPLGVLLLSCLSV